MRVFVTGATGFVGSAVVPELLQAGHAVLGLARSDASAAALARMGAEVHRGDLDDPESLAAGAAACDGVIHCAFVHDFTDLPGAGRKDRAAIAAMGAALAGSGRPLVVTSGLAHFPQGRMVTESDMPDRAAAVAHRVEAEYLTVSLAQQGVRACVLRLPFSVHGAGDHAFVPMLIGLARDKGVSGYLDAGANHWCAVHRLDAARLFRLAVERAEPGARYHAIGDSAVPFRDIAAAIGQRLDLPVRSVAPDHFGWLGHFVALDIPTSAELTRERLGWRPEQPGLLEDLGGPAYLGAA